MATPHDSLFHRIFADKAHAAALFRLLLPPELVAAIDWDTLTALPCRITDEKLKDHYPDFVFSARLRDHDLYVVLVPEYKSGDDSGAVLQVLRYALNIWLNWPIEHPGTKGLPPIIPVLFHDGKKPWRRPTSLRDHFDLAGLAALRAKDPALAAVIEASGVTMALNMLDLAGRDEEWLRTIEMDDLPRLTLLCMHFVRFQDPAQGIATLDRWRDLIAAVHRGYEGQAGFAGVESYLLDVTELEEVHLTGVVQRATGTGEKVMSTAERLRKEGEARGKAEGRTEHAVETVLRLLTRRFGEPAEAVALRVRAASLVELDRWTERVLDARTLDDVFAAD